MNCRTCSADFTPPGKRGPPASYCGPACRSSGQASAKRAAYKYNPEKRQEKYQHDRGKRMGAATAKSGPGKCASCEAPVNQFFAKSMRAKKYCAACDSTECPVCLQPKVRSAVHCGVCRKTLDRQRSAERRYPCQGCGKQYRPRRNSSDGKKYCSRQCADLHRYDLSRRSAHRPSCSVYFLSCLCGKSFASPKPNKRHCSEACAQRAKSKPCAECGATFVPDSRSWQRLCSPACEEIRAARRKLKAREMCRAWTRKHREKYGSDKFRSKARRLGLEYEPVSLAKVLERDGWKCGICRQRISKRAKYPNPEAPSLDHIVPMSKGGPHTYANTQAAHCNCNSRKGAGCANDQLLLVG